MKNAVKYIIVMAIVIAVLGTSQSAWADGTIAAFGYNLNYQCDVSHPNTTFTAVATGGYHSLGLKADGSIVAWGWNGLHQLDIPAPNTDFTAVAAGGGHSLGLKADSSIVAWGWNGKGQCDIPLPNSGFTAIAAGGSHSLGLKTDGSIVAWGCDDDGQCDVPLPNEGFDKIAAGGYHSLGIKAGGSIVAWGNNDNGQCGVPLPNAGFSAIAAGEYHSLGLRTGGSIVGWGHNGWGQLNVQLPNSGFTAVAAGWSHSLGLRSNGSLAAWGYNNAGQCNVPLPNSGFTAIATGSGMHNLAIGPSCASVSDVKSCSYGRTVFLESAIVTAGSAQMGGFFYLEDDERFSGIRITGIQSRSMGDEVCVSGRLLRTASGELSISLAQTTLISPSNPLPPPSAMNIKALGGAAFGPQVGITGASGLNNVGLLVRICGKFNKTSDTTFTLDDGSGVTVKCTAPSGVVLDPSWTNVSATGISSCEKDGASLNRLLRLRGLPDDIFVGM